jgi:hypothetical protein
MANRINQVILLEVDRHQDDEVRPQNARLVDFRPVGEIYDSKLLLEFVPNG